MQTIPESNETLGMQLEAVVRGRTPAMLVTPGEEFPEIPQGMRILDTDVGTWIYNPMVIGSAKIEQMVADGSYGEILGYVEPKPDYGQVVTARQNGIEAKSGVVSPENVEAQAENFQMEFPGAEIDVGEDEEAIRVLMDRILRRQG